MVGNRLKHLEIVVAALVPATDCTARQAQFVIGDHFERVEKLACAQTITGAACTCRVVEREQTRFKLTDAVTTMWAGKVSREDNLRCIRFVHIRYFGVTCRQRQRGFETFCQTQLQVVTHFEAVDNHFNSVLFVQIQFRWIRQVTHVTVNTCPNIALGS